MVRRLPKLVGVIGSGQMGVRRLAVAGGRGGRGAPTLHSSRQGHSTPNSPWPASPPAPPPAQAGIAQVAAAAGLAVRLIDRSEAQLERATAGILDSLKRLAAKGKVQEEAVEGTLGRITPGTELEVRPGGVAWMLERRALCLA